MAAVEVALLRTTDVVRATGVSYRQLDSWTTAGLVRPVGAVTSNGDLPRPFVQPDRPGSGQARLWHPDEVRVVRTMGRLVGAGLAPACAARVARDLVERGSSELAPSLYGWPAVVAVFR